MENALNLSIQILMKLFDSIRTNSHAFKLIVLLGVVSLFADMTYEGARSITGPYLALLGVSAVTVGFVAGFGEFLGYALRLASGFLVDKTHKYWMITILGYFINLLAVPLIGLTTVWELVAILIILERVGKAIRTPARDAMLSYAGHSIGMGFGFGIHEALDQIGGMLGPLIVSFVLFRHEGYREAFLVLAIPAVFALVTLFLARNQYPKPRDLEPKFIALEAKGLKAPFWIYLMGAALVAAGFADFPLMAYHFELDHLLSAALIPLVYAFAMGGDALFSPILGYCFDRFGMKTILVVTFISAWFAPLVFLSHSDLFIFIGVLLWAVGIGSQASIMRAVIGNMVDPDHRASSYGIFNVGFGLFWFLGSVTMGFLYDHSILALVIFSMIVQCSALFFFMRVKIKVQHQNQV